jgi:hypothetical protein
MVRERSWVLTKELKNRGVNSYFSENRRRNL